MNMKIILILPILELILFILFGDFLGFFPVISLIIISGLVGFFFLRSGMNPKNIAENPKEWIFTKFAGILLLIPGFATDCFGVFLLVKSLRYLIWDYVPEKTKNYFTVAKVHNVKEAFLAKGFIDLIFLSPVLKTDSYPEKKPLSNYIFISLCFFFKEEVIFALGGVNYKNIKSMKNKNLHGFGAISCFNNYEKI